MSQFEAAGLIGTCKDPTKLFIGYVIGAGVMIIGGLVAAFLAVDAEGKPLEDIATPFSMIRKGGDRPQGPKGPSQAPPLLPRRVHAV